MTENKPLTRGRTFEQFNVGDKVITEGRTITEADIVAFAGLSGDFNRIHTDAEYAAATRGARVTALTISPSQLDDGRARIRRAGLADRVDLRLQDYRDVTGIYDKAVSIEMFEAVGERYWPVYFGKLADILRPGGAAALQIITIE